MTTYKGIQGQTVQSLSSDLTASSDTAGELWYNSEGGKFKIVQEGAGAWSSGGDLNTGRNALVGLGTTNSAVLGCGGTPSPSNLIVESYDGTSWTEIADTTNAHQNYPGPGIGSQTAGLLAASGSTPEALVEEWNGTAWSEEADLNTARQRASCSAGGTVTAGLCFGGGSSAPGSLVNESYNGTSWTEEADLNFGRYTAVGAGTSTDALVAGDQPAIEEDKSETWNGTAWTAANDLNGGGYAMAGAGATSSTAWVMGGTPEAKRRGVGTSNTEHFDGTSWTEVADAAAPLEAPGSAGTTTSGISMGGSNNPGTQLTALEWNDPVYTVKTVTVS